MNIWRISCHGQSFPEANAADELSFNCIYSGRSPLSTVFLSAYILYVQVPGHILLNLVKVRYGSTLIDSLISFFCGCFVLFFEYYLFSFLNISWMIIYFNVAISIIYILRAVFNGEKTILDNFINSFREKIFDIRPIALVFFGIIITGFMLNLQFQYVSPTKYEFTSLGQDFLWHMGNINSLANSFPPLDYRISENHFFYHYFQDLLYGICLKIFKIPADVVIFTCSPYLLTYLFGGSLLVLFRKFCKKKNNAEIYGIIFILLSLCPLGVVFNGEKWTASWLNIHIFSNVNCVAFALSAVIVFIISLEQCCRLSNIMISALIMFVVTGLKGPMAIVIIAGMIMALIIEAFVNRALNKKHTMIVITSLISFLIVYLFIISGIQMGSSPKGSNLNLFSTDTIDDGFFYNIMFDYIENNVLSYIIIVMLEMICLVGALAIPYLIYIISEGKNILSGHDDRNSWIRNIIYFSIFTGIGGFLFVGQSGFSQIYFLFTILPFMYMEVICMIEKRNEYSKIKKTFVLLSFAIGFLVSSYYFINDVKELALTALYKSEEQNVEEESFFTGMLRDEFAGMVWLRENTPNDSVIATDRRNITENECFEMIDGRYYYCSAYSQRKIFMEGTAFSSITDNEINKKMNILKKIYSEENLKRGDIARENGIDYVVVTKTASGNIDLSNEDLKLCYNNDRIKIYKVKDRI